MPLAERRALIRTIEEARGSTVLVHLLSDRRVSQGAQVPGMTTQLAGEAYPYIFRQLRRLGHVAHLDLVLHTQGGHLDAVWPIVRLCRSFCDSFSVLVPFRAYSAGTLICLGADTVIMG